MAPQALQFWCGLRPGLDPAPTRSDLLGRPLRETRNFALHALMVATLQYECNAPKKRINGSWINGGTKRSVHNSIVLPNNHMLGHRWTCEQRQSAARISQHAFTGNWLACAASTMPS